MSHLSATGARNVVAITADASPKVPGIMMTVDHLEAIRSGQVLDGLECIDCVFEDATLRYSGGAYRLINPTFKGRVTVEFSGPAYDAVFLEHVVTAIGSGPKPQAPTVPKQQIAMVTAPAILNVVSPELGK